MTMQADPELQSQTELPGEGDAAETTKADATEPTTDWKAKYEATETARAKVENDLKALRGLRTTEAQREERMDAILDRVDAIDKQQSALIKALGNNTTEELPAEVARLQATSQQGQAARRFAGQYKSLYDDFIVVGQDDEGNVVLDVEKAPELEEARRTFAAGYNRTDIDNADRLVMFAKAISQGQLATKKALRARGVVEAKKVKDEAQASVKKRLDDAGVLDLDTGREAGGGGAGAKTWAAAQKIKKMSDLSDADYEKLVAG